MKSSILACFVVLCICIASADKGQQDYITGADTSQKCLSCLHIVKALRGRYFQGDKDQRDLQLGDPCHSIAKGLRPWCADVYRKLSACPTFLSKTFDRSIEPDRICEACDYDEYPLPSVKFCDNPSMQVPVNLADQCLACIRIVQGTRARIDPCAGLPLDRCRALQTKLNNCAAYQSGVRLPRADARSICERCEAIMPFEGDYHEGRMMCDRPNPTPLKDGSRCSTCINIVHNTRFFKESSPCMGMDQCECNYVQNKLSQCYTFSKMLDYQDFPAKSICQECRDDANPLKPVAFCETEWNVPKAMTVTPMTTNPFAEAEQPYTP